MRKLFYRFIFFFPVLFSFAPALHPYYVSTTEIRINSREKTVTLSCKMFTDDLQDALSTLYKVPADLVKKKSLCDSLLNSYVRERTEVAVGDKKLDFKYAGYEIEEEVTWCYFEAKLPSEDRIVNVSSSVLYDFLPSQTNFLHCYYDKEKQSYKLDSPKRTASFNFVAK